MIKPLYIVLCLLAFSTVSCQGIDAKQKKDGIVVPRVVQKSFEKKYPYEKSPKWEIDDHGYYEAGFKDNGIKYRADFMPNGAWIETENSIKKKDLPKVIQDIIKVAYRHYEIAEIEHVSSAEKGIFYDVEFKQKGKNKDVEFDPSGRILN